MSTDPSFRERRKAIIERTLLETNYLDENADVLADAILDALAAVDHCTGPSVELVTRAENISGARPDIPRRYEP